MSKNAPPAAGANNNSRELDIIQQELNEWHAKQSAQLKAQHAKFSAQIRALEDLVLNGANSGVATPTPAPAPVQRPGSASAQQPAKLDWDQLTPSRQTGGQDSDVFTPSMASPPVSHPLSFETLIEEVERDKVRKAQAAGATGPQRADGARPINEAGGAAAGNGTPSSLKGGPTRPTPDTIPGELLNVPSPTNRNTPCQVLVEFKRRRVLQFESPSYVAPGEYVVVGGDRGEDIGLVTHTWASGTSSTAPEHVAKWAGVGLGKVLRVATVLEVSQLQGVQTELEARAVEVAQEKVVEHGLHMRIVDAEYQFDRKKLTFYYQSQSRLDFRNLVRDLYKTFRARIWMEQD